MARLLVISSAPATLVDGKPYLDTKFVAGMRLYNELWNGSVGCILKQRDGTFPFGRTYTPDQLPFEISLLQASEKVGPEEINGYDIILCGGDNHEYLSLADICRVARKKLIYNIEYIPETRRQIIFLDRSRDLPRKIYSLLWTMTKERRRRKAFHLADGIQANGYPAFALYNSTNSNTMMYLDNRVGQELLATEREMNARYQYLMRNAPLRLVHSGRLEPLKGSQDLIPVARKLVQKGINFTLDIFGSGSLEGEIRKGIYEYGLQDRVKLHGAVDFETELVPFVREHADVYLSCHRQSDPSCTYIESMACGLAVIGYENRMWSALCQESRAGWSSPLGDSAALVNSIVEAAKSRDRLSVCCRAAWNFASQHTFEQEFQRRIDHLKALA